MSELLDGLCQETGSPGNMFSASDLALLSTVCRLGSSLAGWQNHGAIAVFSSRQHLS